MTAIRVHRNIAAAVSVPWNLFVAAFLYFVLLTAAVIGGADFSATTMMVAYLLPVGAYAAILVSRAVHALGAVVIHIEHAPHAVIH